MRMILFMGLILANSLAQTGPRPVSNNKRILVCCGKSTNQVSAPTSPSNTKAPITNTIKQ